MDRENLVYLQNVVLLTYKNKPYVFMKFLGKWLELENIFQSEVSQSQNNTHCVFSLISTNKTRSLEHPIFISQSTWSSRRQKTKMSLLWSFLDVVQNTHVRKYRGKLWTWDCRKDHPETAPPVDPYHVQWSNRNSISIYCGYQQFLADGSLKKLFPERRCQYLKNTEGDDTLSQPLNWAQAPQRRT